MECSLATVSGLLLTLAAPGVGLGALAWIALVPLYRALGGARLGHAALLGWLTGFAFAATSLWWIALPVGLHSRLGLAGGIVVAILVAAVYALPIAAYATALVFYERRLGSFGITLAAVLWSGLEWMRTLGPLPLPWCLLGYSQPARSSVSQLAEWSGVYGIGALIVLVNAAIHVGTAQRETSRRTARRLAAATLVVALAFAVGEWRRAGAGAGDTDGPPLRIGIVQPALVPGVVVAEPRAESVAESLSRQLSGVALDAIVWPEGAAPFALLEEADAAASGEEFGSDLDLRDRLLELARELGLPLVVGAAAVVREPLGRGGAWSSRNRIALVEPTGEFGAHVDKTILVPFGEFVPARAILRGIEPLVPGYGDYRPGTETPILRVAGTEAAVVICWEAIFPAFVAAAATRAGVILDLTNDAWLGAELAAEQHFAMAAMRAVETRRPLVRAANSGISAFVEPTGEVRQKTRFGARGAIVGEVRPRKERTFYGRHGDVFAIGTALAAVALLVYAGRSRPRSDEPAVLPLES